MKTRPLLTAAAMLALLFPACTKKETPAPEPSTEVQKPEETAMNLENAGENEPLAEDSKAEAPKEEKPAKETKPFIQPDLDTSEAQAIIDSKAFKTKGIEAYYENKSELTSAELEALFIASQNDKVREDENFPVGSTALTVESILWEHRSDPLQDRYHVYRKLLHHSSGTVRGMVLKQYADQICFHAEDTALAVELLKTETDDFAISMGLASLRQCLSSHPEAIEAAKKAAKSENPLLRAAAARALSPTGNQIEGAEKIVVDLMHDKIRDVRDVACTYIGLFKNDELIPEIMKIVLDPAQEDLHYACTSSLFTMWYDYPTHQNTSEKAFEATIEVMRTLPEVNKGPTWGTIEKMLFANESTIGDWRTRMGFTGEKRDRYMTVMKALALNTKLDFATRNAAISVMRQHAPDLMPSLFTELKKLKDKDSKRLVSMVR